MSEASSLPTTTPTRAWGTTSPTSPLEFLTVPRRAVGATDVEIDIEYCGMCHSDYHVIKDEWGMTRYNCVPGHEVVGTVLSVGADVTKFKVGDLVGVGCMVDSCQTCDKCHANTEQYCRSGRVRTYNGVDKHLNQQTYGGYSTKIVVTEGFVLRMPANLGKAASAPLLCAGITTYSPLRKAGVTAGTRVGVVGLGGLGHVGIKLAVAMGAKVTIITTSQSKVDDAKRLGAIDAVLSSDPAQMAAAQGRLDFILDTVSAPHDVAALMGLLDTDGTICLVGLPPGQVGVSPMALVSGAKTVTGSLIGGVKETQEMLDFCAEHNVVSDIEMVGVDGVNDAFERMVKGDVKYRFVIDMQTLKDYSE